MFNSRQLLALTTLLRGIGEESNRPLRDLLLSAFEMTLEANNVFTWNRTKRNTPGGTAPAGIFRRHEYHPKIRICEQNVWETVSGANTFRNREKMLY